MFSIKKLATALAVSAGLVTGVHAATATTTFKVKIVITESCEFAASATDVDFGIHARTASTADVDAAGALTLTCTQGTPYTVTLNNGLNYASSTRNMINGSELIPYGLFTTAARTTAWGSALPNAVTGIGTAAAQTLQVFGRTNSLNHPAGSYEDTVTATVTY